MGVIEAPPPDGEKSFLHQTDRGELRLWLPAPTVFVFKYKGFSDASFMPFVEKVWDATAAKASGPIQVFADTEEQTGFDQGFRTRLVSWSKTMVWKTDVYFLLVKSRWVAMGIAIVRSAVGMPAAHAEVTTKRQVYEARLAEAIERSIASRRAELKKSS